MKPNNYIRRSVDYFQGLIFSGHSRSVLAKKNILSSFFIKGVNILISFLMVPIVIDYLDATKYGIWMTVGSIISWFAFFDLGLGNGLRNRFAEAKANSDMKSVRIYISTTYALLTLIIVAVYVIYLVVNRFVNWSAIFNSPADLNKELGALFFVVFSFFALRFIIQIILTILIADQRPALADLIRMLSHAVSAAAIFILTLTKTDSLVLLGFIYSSVPVLIMAIATLYFFMKDYREYIPGIRYIDFSYARSLMSLGIRFFVIQIAVVIMFTTDNMIVTQLFGPEYVTPYSIAYKYFGMITMVFTIIMTPFWSAFTESWVIHDTNWIRRMIRKLTRIWLLFLVGDALLFAFSGFIYRIWIGPEIVIPVRLSLMMSIYVITAAFGSIFVNFINGTGKIRLQYYTAIFSAVLNIPLSVLFAKTLNLGLAGIILATFVCISYGPFIAPIQYLKLINGKAKGIWNR